MTDSARPDVSFFIRDLCGAGTQWVALNLIHESTRCPFGPAEILRDGELGAFTPVGEAGALAAAINRALDHPIPSATLREASREQDISTIAARYLSVLGIRTPERSGSVFW